MKFKYKVMWFEIPNDCGGNCGLVEEFKDPDEAYKRMNELEANNSNFNKFYYVVLFES